MKRTSPIPARPYPSRAPVRFAPSWWKRNGEQVIGWLALSGVVLGLSAALWNLRGRI